MSTISNSCIFIIFQVLALAVLSRTIYHHFLDPLRVYPYSLHSRIASTNAPFRTLTSFMALPSASSKSPTDVTLRENRPVSSGQPEAAAAILTRDLGIVIQIGIGDKENQ